MNILQNHFYHNSYGHHKQKKKFEDRNSDGHHSQSWVSGGEDEWCGSVVDKVGGGGSRDVGVGRGWGKSASAATTPSMDVSRLIQLTFV